MTKPCFVVLLLLVVTSAGVAQEPSPTPPSPEPPKVEPKDRFPEGRGPAVVFSLPKEWKARESKSTMRLAEYQLPGMEPADCTVFWFGEKGAGTVEANLERWVGQFEDAGEPKKVVVEPAKGFKATLVDVSGTYAAPIRPGAREKLNKPGWRMLGVVLETPGGPLYIKAVGPSATIDAAHDDFMAWIRSFRAASGR